MKASLDNIHQRKRYAKKIADLLKYARCKAGLSSRQLASHVGTSHSTILAYENQKKTPSTTTFLRLIKACNYSVDFVLSPRIRGNAEYTRGEELVDVLNLADEFPVKHGQKLNFPRLPMQIDRS